MKPITRLVNGIYVGATDPAVYAPGSPRGELDARVRAQAQEDLSDRLTDLLAFDPTRSSSLLLPRPSAAWTAPENGQRFAARLAKAISLSYESPLGLQITDCLMLATNYPHERAFTLLRDLEVGLEHVVAACNRFSMPEATPCIARARLLSRVVPLQANEAVGDQSRILYLLAIAGLVIAGQDLSQMGSLRGCLTNAVLDWEPLKHHPVAHSLLDDFLDLQWPADPARALKQASYEVQGRGRSATAAAQAQPGHAPKALSSASEERSDPRAGQKRAGDDRPMLSCTGETWTVSWRGKTKSVVGRTGMRDLATLIAQPDVPISAYELAGVRRPEAAQGTAVLDKRGFAEVRRRLEDLDGIETDAAEEEREALLQELKTANQGLGQGAMLGSDDKRVRQAVTKRIREAIEAIRAVHEELGLHLSDSIQTGSAPVYSPARSPSTDAAPKST